MSQKIKIVFLTILTLMVINCGYVFASSVNGEQVQEIYDGLKEKEGNIKITLSTDIINDINNYATQYKYSTVYYENNLFIRFSNEKPIMDIDNRYLRVQNFSGYYIEIIYATGNLARKQASGENYVRLDRPSEYLFLPDGAVNNTGSGLSDEFFAGWQNEELISLYKKPYFTFSAEKIGTATIENRDENINTYYKNNFELWSNSYGTFREIGNLYVDSKYIWDNIFFPKLYITKNDLNFQNQWNYNEYSFYKEEEIDGYIRYSINIKNDILNAPYFYNIAINTVNSELSENINIQFIVINEKDNTGGIIIENNSGDRISGDEIADNTTLGDINNSINNIFQPPNEEEIQKEEEESINKIKEEINGYLEENEIMKAMKTAQNGFIDILKGEAGDFKISWEEVEYYNTAIIPAGEINFSKMARDIEILKTIKLTVNSLMSGFLALKIIKYSYNLILQALGVAEEVVPVNNNKAGDEK